jgi:hypothetical protein
MTINVTQTQKFVAQAALAAVGADHLAENPAAVDQVVRAILVIQQGRMQGYMLNGFNWSCSVRKRREPVNAFLDRHNLEEAVKTFMASIDGAKGEAGRRIRGNRARRRREADRLVAKYLREKEERREKRRLQRELKLAAQPIERLIA